jgi:hypothetical protein
VASHGRRGNVDDSYIAVNEECFGRVLDIMWLPEYRAALVKLDKYEKKTYVDENSAEMMFPVNQFPVKRSREHVFLRVTDSDFVQKIVKATLVHKKRPLEKCVLFAKRPNEWFRF